ncbi:serine/threonine-protein kinase ATM-like isoform X3 [Primulina tabacum]|uniref:serine/threonine-protein kinase ATM-like isoform X3 n=1 Tax=Primulina tabacum TaxID=48773 RepID=UPI003F5AB149
MLCQSWTDLVLLYMETCLSAENVGRLNPKEEVFCSTLTRHPLLENQTGDIPDDLQDNIILGFVGIFSHARDEVKISRKLVECINTYLLEDRPNLGGKSLEIHQAINHFVFRILLFAMGSCKNLLGLSLLMFFTAPGVKSSLKSAFPLNEVGVLLRF